MTASQSAATELDKSCCVRCFDDEHVQAFIRSFDDEGACSYCGSRRQFVATVAKVGEVVHEGLARAYLPSDHEAGPYDREEDTHIFGDPWDAPTIEDTLVDEGLFSHRLDHRGKVPDLAADLISAGKPPITSFKDYEPPLFGGSLDSVRIRDHWWKPEQDAEKCRGFEAAWDEFRVVVMHRTRFFDGGVAGFRRLELVSRVSGFLRNWLCTLPIGSSLWRARIPRRSDPADTDLSSALGPAPAQHAGRSRFSPRGVPCGYFSSHRNLACAEVAVGKKGASLVGEFETKVPLKILDLMTLSETRRVSIFSEAYDHEDRWLWSTAHAFARDIATPIRKGETELLYVPTQVVAEYLRLEGVQGIKYPSAVRKNGWNLALFCGPWSQADGHRGAPPPASNWLVFRGS